eukprot:gene4088-4640_t
MAKFMFSVAIITVCIFTNCAAGDPQKIPPEVKKQVSALSKYGGKVQKINLGLGILSRSMIVHSLSKALRGEDGASVQESLNQAITTLAVLDVGGGILSPILSEIIDAIATDPAFKETRKALKEFGTSMVGWADDLDDLPEGVIKSRLTAMKGNILSTFDTDIGHLASDHRALKHINKAKNWLKLKFAGKVLGPIFDLACVGVNAWSLGTTIRDCNTNPATCNVGAISAASLSIASGLVGIVTFAVVLKASAAVAAIASPIGALVAAVLGITATLIELFYSPPPDPAVVARLEKENRMRQLDIYSRIQLNSTRRFLAQNKVEREDIYVVNQGHLPKWFSYTPAINKLQLGKTASFKPRKKQPMIQKCEKPIWGDTPVPPGAPPTFRRYVCPYLAEGVELSSTENSDDKLGYSFYGFTKYVRQFKYMRSPIVQPYDDPPYAGSMVIIPTDKVQPDNLRPKGLEANLRGLDLDTATKGNDNGEYDDLIAIGDMPTLDTDATVRIRTGKGNDALNIDGRLGASSRSNLLDAELGPEGYNTLNFGAMASDLPIEGISFSAHTGRLEFKYGPNVHQRQHVGSVKHVQFLGASPFRDDIRLYANKAGEKGVDFVTFKFKGRATYTLQTSYIASQSAVRHFQINDNTEGENGCTGHYPVLTLYGLPNGARANDIQYKDDKIYVYFRQGSNRKKRQSDNSVLKKIFGINDFSEKRQLQCAGQTGSDPILNPRRRLVATIAFNTKCPGLIRANTRRMQCVTRRRSKFELDTKFYPGKKQIVDFQERNYQGTDLADYVILKCPSSTVTQTTTIDLSSSSGEDDSDISDYLVIGSEMFLLPCGIDGEQGATIRLNKMAGDDSWLLRIYGSSKFTGDGIKLKIPNVDYIINEFGKIILDLNDIPSAAMIDVYVAYSHKTTESIAEILGKERTDEIKENILTCIKERPNPPDPSYEELCKT